MTELCPVSVGQKVPDFTMETYEPETGAFGKVSLAQVMERKRWVVLVFYPANFTFVCPTELADLAERQAELKELGCEVVSVSTDTKYAHYSWRYQEKLLEQVNYIMAADPTGAVAKLFGIYDFQSGLALRGTFIINPEGMLVSSEIHYYSVGRDANELMRKIRGFQYVYAHPDEVCPAKWQPGQKTLTPGQKLIGKVHEGLQ